jgi:hypothetical protein
VEKAGAQPGSSGASRATGGLRPFRAAALLALVVAAGLPAAETDPASGLIIDEHWQLVLAHCGACHSTRLVTQNRGSREAWLKMIRWMQETQGLWALNGPQERAILDYLAKNYAPAESARRAPLAPALMPPNPYDSN